MIWSVVIIIAAVAFLLMLRKNRKEKMNQALYLPDGDVLGCCPAEETDDGELPAVITAAVAEFEGVEELHALRFMTCGREWKLTGRQELVYSRR